MENDFIIITQYEAKRVMETEKVSLFLMLASRQRNESKTYGFRHKLFSENGPGLLEFALGASDTTA